MTMRPFLSYYGSKWRLAKQMPPPYGSPIIEPFAGSAGYATRYGADREVILIDADPTIAGLWAYLITADPDRIRSLPDIPPGGTVADTGLTGPELALVGFWVNRGAARPSKTPSKWMRENWHPRTENYWSPAARNRIAEQVPRIRNWTVIHGDYTAAPDTEAVWIIDPPYQQAGHYYVHGSQGFDYQALAEWARTRRGTVIVHEMAGADWLPFTPLHRAKATNKNGSRWSDEVWWTNLPLRTQQPALF